MLFLLALGACQGPSSQPTPPDTLPEPETSPVPAPVREDIGLDQFKSLIGQPDHILLDVRTPEEITEGMIEGAQHIDFHGEDFGAKIKALDKDKTYLVYCRSGNRSGQTTVLMEREGFKKAYNLMGGYTAWKAATQQ